MKKGLFVFFVLLITSGVFAQEYTIYVSGSVRGFISIQKELNGKITVTPHIGTQGWVWIGRTICPVLPEEGFYIRNTTQSIVIDGNTITVTNTDGSYSWRRAVIEGNTITETGSSGRLVITVLDGNTLTRTHPNQTLTRQNFSPRGAIEGPPIVSENWWQRIVVTGNTMTETDSIGSWSRAVINGNTTTVTKDGSLGYEEVIRGNTRTLTYSYGSGYREVVEGNTITVTSLDGKNVEVVEKQGNDVFITITGYGFTNIGVSERDRIRNVIDGITSGRLTEGLFYELIDYGR